MMNLTQARGCCPHCGIPVELLHGGPERHGRFGWYVGLAPYGDDKLVQIIVYAMEDTKESAVARARLLLRECPELHRYTHRVALHTAPGGRTSRGGDIEVLQYSEGIV